MREDPWDKGELLLNFREQAESRQMRQLYLGLQLVLIFGCVIMVLAIVVLENYIGIYLGISVAVLLFGFRRGTPTMKTVKLFSTGLDLVFEPEGWRIGGEDGFYLFEQVEKLTTNQNGELELSFSDPRRRVTITSLENVELVRKLCEASLNTDRGDS